MHSNGSEQNPARRATVGVLIASAFAVAGALAVAIAAAAQPQTRVRIDSGDLLGVSADGVISFKGIPFAAPPVGGLRWRPPQPAPHWNGVRSADTFGPDCMQFRVAPMAQAGRAETRAPSEDCLYLNVWRPANPSARKLPVLVWIYGGGFVVGSSASPMTAGTSLARSGIVTVAMNYRLGRFGFFGHPALSAEHPEELKGNYGYMDLSAAIPTT
jgi:para-nitrobenzyl esterase